MAKTLKTTSTFSIPTLHSNTKFLCDTASSYIKYFCIIFTYSFLFVKNTHSVRKGRKHILHKLFLRPNNGRSYKISRLNRICQSLFLWLCIINFMLITITNPSMLNPGPTNTKNCASYSVYYQNIQGLIPFSQLSEEHPTLHTTKLHEIGYFFAS